MSKYRLEVVLGVQTSIHLYEELFKNTIVQKKKQYCYSDSNPGDPDSGTRIPGPGFRDPDSGTRTPGPGRRDPMNSISTGKP